MRISVTTLEQFNRFVNGDINKDELIQRLTTKFEGNIYTERGTNFHALIENYDGINYSVNNHHFNKDQIDLFINEISDFKNDGVAEVKAVKIFNIDNEEVTLVGKADYYKGNSILELKTTAYFNAESYDDSVQWRAYMDLFGVNEVVYKVATIEDNEGFITIKKVDTLVKTYYEGIKYELYTMIRGFIQFLKTYNICLIN